MSRNEHRSLAFLEDPGLLLLICSNLVWGECRTGDYTWCPDTELLAVGGCVRHDRSHSYPKCPEGDRNAPNSMRGQTPRGQVMLTEVTKNQQELAVIKGVRGRAQGTMYI